WWSWLRTPSALPCSSAQHSCGALQAPISSGSGARRRGDRTRATTGVLEARQHWVYGTPRQEPTPPSTGHGGWAMTRTGTGPRFWKRSEAGPPGSSLVLAKRPALPDSLFERFVEGFHLPAEAGPIASAECVERGAVVRAARRGCGHLRRGCGCRSLDHPRWRCTGLEHRREGRLERWLHRQPIVVGDDHALQLRELPLLRAQVERLHVHQRVLDRDHQQVPADHLRAHLVPERELLRDDGVLVDTRLDLLRPVDEPLLRELVLHE